MSGHEEPLTEAPVDDRLYVHTRRPEWGAGLLTAAGDGRWRFQFQDGSRRAIKEGWYHLLKPIDADDDRVEDILEQLRDRFGTEFASAPHLRAGANGEGLDPAPMSFDDQVRVFRQIYDGGFAGDSYKESVRAVPDGRVLKRLRDPIVKKAGEDLSRAALGDLIDQGSFTEVFERAVAVMGATDLVGMARVVRPVQAIDVAHHERFARLLHDLLWGEGEFAQRFSAWLRLLDEVVEADLTWPMATVLPGVVHPDFHVVVKRKPFHTQAQILRRRRGVRSSPNPKAYRRAQRIASKVRDLLQEADMKPVDLLDVREFVWETLRPKGQKVLAELDGD